MQQDALLYNWAFFEKNPCNDIDMSGNAGQLLLYFVQQLKLPFPTVLSELKELKN